MTTLLFGCLLGGCTADYLTDEDCFPTKTTVNVHIGVGDSAPLCQEPLPENLIRRYVVKAYQGEAEVARYKGFEPDFSLTLPLGDIRVCAFVDYVDASERKSLHFLVDEFSELLLRRRVDYGHNESGKMAYYGNADVTVESGMGNLEVTTKPVMGRYVLKATDKTDHWLDHIKILYSTSIPSAIDGLTGDICLSWSGIELQLYDFDNLLCFDNIIATGKGIEFKATIEVYDYQGKLVARTKNTPIRIRPGEITEVSHPIFTNKEFEPKPEPKPEEGGITIDSEFDETVVIEM